ncbi:zinc finger protein 648 [Parambassis ranga]|uniref:Zinc finger protein 648 n=1 Tax=Parambassis ranga TaxID=210632 RepID=A0A6P7IV68_9TELE|nr:zinc finger protein 648-like [Parambassis ranga]
MNGAVYISFFQGQLESVLEQVVQLAVQEISKTVGCSLNALLLETAMKEQENRRLRVQLQSRESRGRVNASDSGGSPVAGKNKTGKAAGEETVESGRTKPEPQQQLHAPGGQATEPGVPTDARRLEQRGRVVDQLKSVMEQVLDFAVRELTKIVEASFDDLLLEITKMEREQQVLEKQLGTAPDRKGAEKGRGGAGVGPGGRRRGSENDSASPSGSEDAREEVSDVTMSKERAETNNPERPPVLSVAQDWVPILDKVFGQKWCSDVWQIKEVGTDGGGGRGTGEGGAQHTEPLSNTSVTLEPSPSSPQQDPRWTPLEDMEVFSHDDEPAVSQKSDTSNNTTTTVTAPSPGTQHSPTGRRSSASMLHRLLTLPSQLLEDDDEEAKETLVTVATDGNPDSQDCFDLPDRTTREAEEEEEEEEEEDEEEKGRKKKRRRVWSECEECGRRFSRMSLLKAHRQTHAGNATTDTPSPSSPPAHTTTQLRCSECGKRFYSATRLQSHIRTQHPGKRS